LNSAAARQTVANLAGSLREGGYLMVSPDEESLIVSTQLTQSEENASFFQRSD
jgi:hypothetical protein